MTHSISPDAITFDDADTILKCVKALELRAQHFSYREIARTLGLKAVSHAYKLVQRGLRETLDSAQEPADDAREMELQRLDMLSVRLWAKIERQTVEVTRKDGSKVMMPNPDERTIESMMSIMRHRAELKGLYAPKRIGLGGDGDAPPIMGAFAQLPDMDPREVIITKFREMVERRLRVIAPADGSAVVTTVPAASPTTTPDEVAAHG